MSSAPVPEPAIDLASSLPLSACSQLAPLSTAAFEHNALRATEIRLLSFTPGWLDLDLKDRSRTAPSLLCETFDRATAPPYTALSYEWGDNAYSRTIILNGRPFSVRQNLWNALIHLPLQMSGYLWIDALCIDQDNTTERNHQVKAMGLIYSQAQLVIAWLGPDEDDVRACMSPTADESMAIVIQACRALLAKSYWNRMWIWQEFLLAKSVLLASGSHSLTMAGFQRHIKRNAVTWPPLAYFLYEMKFFHAHMTLVGALYSFGSCICSDPRDRIFAVLNLLEESERAPLLGVFPDYSLSADSVALTVLGHIRNGKSGQHTLCSEAERILYALGATGCEELWDFGDVLRAQEHAERRLERRFELGTRRRRIDSRNELRHTDSFDTFIHGEDRPRVYFSASLICKSLDKPVPGMTLTKLQVFDCVFGSQDITEWHPHPYVIDGGWIETTIHLNPAPTPMPAWLRQQRRELYGIEDRQASPEFAPERSCPDQGSCSNDEEQEQQRSVRP